MAFVKDWIEVAASEIADKALDNQCDSYCMTVDRAEAKAIIEKHCPMKPDTAYIELPRCVSCQFYRVSPNIKPHCTYLNMQTIPTFGCVAWKAADPTIVELK